MKETVKMDSASEIDDLSHMLILGRGVPYLSYCGKMSLYLKWQKVKFKCKRIHAKLNHVGLKRLEENKPQTTFNFVHGVSMNP